MTLIKQRGVLILATITSLSGNEIICLTKKGYQPGSLVIGNSIYSLGFLGGLSSSIQAMAGGEITQITTLIEEGRETAYKRMLKEADLQHATGITGALSEVIFRSNNIEFLSMASAVHVENPKTTAQFSTSANGQELFAQLDAGYKPICFSFGNVAYSMGVGRSVAGALKTFNRGEIKEYSNNFNHTRHLALERIIAHAKQHRANAVIGIKTSILPFSGVNEMLMIGTASSHSQIAAALPEQIITSDMTNIEMWNMAKLGYAPLRLLLSTSVYSLGLAGGMTSTLKSFARGEINELTTLIYDARENAIGIMNDEAKAIGADYVVGTKIYIYEFGGLIEFLAVGTAVKKIEGLTTESDQLPLQAIMTDQDTFYDSTSDQFNMSVNQDVKLMNNVTTQNNMGSMPQSGLGSLSTYNIIKLLLLLVILVSSTLMAIHHNMGFSYSFHTTHHLSSW